MSNDTGKKNSLGLKVLSLLVVVMFVSVAVVCPVVRSDETSAAVVEEEPEMPEELLNEYIAEELENISNMAEEELMEEFGVTMEEYQESMEALSGTTLMLVGDEDGNISVEITESIDRGRAGPWWEGNYFYFGIESFAWSAIKWWFSSECINMLVDQVCQGEIDAVAIAEHELQQESEALQTLVKDIIDIGGTIERLSKEIASLTASIDSILNDIDALSDEMTTAYQDAIDESEKELTLTEEEMALIDTLVVRMNALNISGLFNSEGNIDYWEYCEISDFFKDLVEMTGISIDSTPFMAYGALVACIYEGDYTNACESVKYGIDTQGENFIINAMTGQLDRIAAELDNTMNDLKIEKQTIKNVINQQKNAVKEAKALRTAARDNIKLNESEINDLESYLERYEIKSKSADIDLKKSIDNYEDSIKKLNDAKIKCDNGEISLDEYKAEKAKFDDARNNMFEKRSESLKWKEKVDVTNKGINEREYKISVDKKAIKEESKVIKDKKITTLKKKVDTLKTGLKAAKAGAKAVAKATAKTACKGAICATGIGTVIMVAVDIVMALLIKFIEDHLDSQGYDTSGDYGVMVKVQVLEKYTVHQTIRIFWRTVTIHFDVIAPCVPRLDGVYMQ